MKTKNLVLLSFVAVAGSLVVMPTARAGQGAVIAPTRLPPADLAELQARIAQARAADPRSFERLAQLRADLPRLDARKRGRLAPLTPMLKSMGPQALMPMLERLATDDPGRGDLTETAWLAWQTSLLEAVGMRRDPRAEPVLRAILDSAQPEFLVRHMAAAAYARLGTDAVADRLVAMSDAAGPWQQPVLAGMGHCRRLVIAQRLADVVQGQPSADTALLVARSLGDVGSVLAWKTPIVAKSGEQTATRAAAAAALVQAYVLYDGAVREMAAKALLVVDDPSTPDLVESARNGADAETCAALDRLANRFANSPIRRGGIR